MDAPRLESIDDALALLADVGAPARLVQHGMLVAEAAQALLDALADLGVKVDTRWVLAGAVLHDAGKAEHPAELDAPGAQHEAAGEALLRARGVPEHIARCCRSHAAWRAPYCAFEELLVALADKLWKGVRVVELEERVVAAVAEQCGNDRWSVFVDLDETFERIADEGPRRVAQTA